MADTPKRVIRLIDNIKLELYEGRKKYAQIWDPIGNNTYNEDDKGPSGVKSPEKSKNFQSAEDDNNVIHFAIENSQIVEYYRLKAKRTNQGKKEDMIDKILVGKLKKVISDNTLMGQKWIHNQEITVEQAVVDFGREIKQNLVIKSFIKYKVGEGIEVKKTDFNEEVKSLAGA